MYCLGMLAFAFYITKFPERFIPGKFPNDSAYIVYMRFIMRKPVCRVSVQIRHKPGCTATKDG